MKLAGNIIEILELNTAHISNKSIDLYKKIKEKDLVIKHNPILLDYFLDNNKYKSQEINKEYQVRRLDGDEDFDILKDLFDRCSADDIDAADIYMDELDPVIVGIFDNEVIYITILKFILNMLYDYCQQFSVVLLFIWRV